MRYPASPASVWGEAAGSAGEADSGSAARTRSLMEVFAFVREWGPGRALGFPSWGSPDAASRHPHGRGHSLTVTDFTESPDLS
ncbi:hypothetical protein GCM10017667_63380 [Streptomyces filamentosus]|uniref:Uncharacterized protein n=1 Tax=Streptomyces filamentosus TaxID=67294 RepID=A0A919BV80_STRFL|nr:hypothetical protein GCM10017667_63380 [Streptomyces filamentosus]